MTHVFISYSHKDSAFVDQLETELNQRSIATWRHKHNIPGGMTWYKSIVDGLDNAYAMIWVISPNADESRWVLREQLYGDERQIPRLLVLMQPHRVNL
ncbi:MAG: toll/interleukin-1 receptor domain-containing protein [Anaerolineae bacterium]|nr:toll/interleukin-1 receptor domain-containing protein [Anaerolineae bacterium]